MQENKIISQEEYTFQHLFTDVSLIKEQKKDLIAKVLGSRFDLEAKPPIGLCEKLIEEGLERCGKQRIVKDNDGVEHLIDFCNPELAQPEYIQSHLLIFALWNELKKYTDPKKVLKEETAMRLRNSWNFFDWMMDQPRSQCYGYPPPLGLIECYGYPYEEDDFYFGWHIDSEDFKGIPFPKGNVNVC